jgi:hypothetical protein
MLVSSAADERIFVIGLRRRANGEDSGRFLAESGFRGSKGWLVSDHTSR